MFDRVFHFGGLNNFGDLKKTFKEMTRVTKMGGKIVVGDEGIAPWLKNTEFGKMLTTSNPLFKNNIPIEHIPENARDITIKHVANGTFYIIKYSIGKGLPYLNSEIEFPISLATMVCPASFQCPSARTTLLRPYSLSFVSKDKHRNAPMEQTSLNDCSITWREL